MRDKNTQRFDAKWVLSDTGCWLWTAATNDDGYGRFLLDGQNRHAHRVAYEWWVGPIPDGLEIDHLCGVRSCVNPEHLEAVTHQENVRRGINWSAVKTHCKSGHPFDEENTYLRPKGYRLCRACRKRWGKEQREKNMPKNFGGRR